MKSRVVSLRTACLYLLLLVSLVWLSGCQVAPTAAPSTSGAPIEAAAPTPTVEAIKSADPIELDWMSVKDPEDDYWKLETGLPGAEPFSGQLIRLVPLNATPQYNIWFFYSKKGSSYDIALNTILTEFRNRNVSASFTVVNVNYASKDAEASLARFAQAVLAAQADQADLIFSAGSDGTKVFFEKYADTLGIPVVSVNAKDPVILKQLPDYETGSGNWMAFTSLNVPIDLEMNYLLQLKPNLKNIAILFSSLNTSAVETQANPVREAAQAMGINVIDVNVENYETVKEELAEKVPLAVADMKKTDPGQQDSIFLITGVTEIFEQISIINQHSEKVALLSVVPDNVKPGDDSAALAIGVSFVSNAQVAAYYGTQILDGAEPGSLKVGIVSPPDIAINFKRARAIGMKVPFTFFESASFVYDGIGQLVRKNGQTISPQGVPVVVAPVIPVEPTPTPFALLPVAKSTPTAAIPEPTGTSEPLVISSIAPENATQVVNLRQLRDSNGSRIALSPTGQSVAVYKPNLSDLTIYRLPNMEKQFTINAGLLTGMAFSPDGSLLALSGVDASISIWNTADGSLSTRLIGLGPRGYWPGFLTRWQHPGVCLARWFMAVVPGRRQPSEIHRTQIRYSVLRF